MPTHDTAESRVIRMPKLTPSTEAVDVWFEQGMILFEAPADPSQVCRCTIADFEERIRGLSEIVGRYEEEYKYRPDDRIVACGKKEWSRFLYDVRDLLEVAKRQIHVGLPIGIIADEAAASSPISVVPGFEGMKNTKAGLISPK